MNESLQSLKGTLKDNGTSDGSIASKIRWFIDNEVDDGQTFFTSDLHKLLQTYTITRIEEKQRQHNNISTALSRIKDGGLIERHGRRQGEWRKVGGNYEVLDFINAPDNALPIQLPMGLHDDLGIEIFEKDIIVIAGVSNHGKSAWLLRFVEMNMREHDVWYFSSGDMSATRLKRRMKRSGVPLEIWNQHIGGKAVEIYGEFSDHVKPDCINVFDFMHEGEKAFRTAIKMKSIKDKLQEGIAVIAIQKSPGKELGWGSDTSLMYSQLYLTIDSGVARIAKAKSWQEDKSSPIGKRCQFKLVNGFEFIQQGIWHRQSDEEDAGVKKTYWGTK